MRLTIFTDGGARGNPGPAAVGIVIKSTRGNVIARFGKAIGVSTNNVAEYRAVIEALDWVRRWEGRRNIKGITVCMDSQLAVSQLTGIFKVKNPALRELIVTIRELEQEVGGNVSYLLVRREENRLADLLVNQALDRLHYRLWEE